jgi:hypothetical protein
LEKVFKTSSIEEFTAAAEANSERYEPMFKKAARAAFMEGAIWAENRMEELNQEQEDNQ